MHAKQGLQNASASENVADASDCFSYFAEIDLNNEQRIAKINELSLHLRSIWIGLLIALVFVGITLMGHRDVDFFAFGAVTTLPVVSVDVHPTAFFLAAPILIAAIYIYLHIFLLSLWDHIGDADAKDGPDETCLSDQVSPTIFTLAAVWYRNRARADGSMAPSVLGGCVVAIALGLGWVFGWLVLLLIWVRGMPLHDFWMTVVAAISVWAATVVAGLSLRSVEGRMRGRSRQSLATVGPIIFVIGGLFLFSVVVTSWERTKGGFLAQLGVSVAFQMPLAKADLREADLTIRPLDWQPFELWILSVDPEQTADATRRSEIERLWQNRVNALEAPDLSGRDLRGADLSNAFLPGANLRGADLTGALLQGANLEGANFRDSTFENVNLTHAALQGAVLSGLKIYRSDFSFARMQFSSLFSARILESDFSHAILSDADLGLTLVLGSRLVRANLENTKFGEATVGRTDFTGSTFVHTDMYFFLATDAQFLNVDFSGSDLSHGFLLNSDFTYAKFNADKFEQTCFVSSNLAGADFLSASDERVTDNGDRVAFSGSSLIDADLSKLKAWLTQDMIDAAFGGSTTQLPSGLQIPAHWSTADVGGIGGGGSFTPVPPWFERTRRQMEASREADDASNRSYYILDGWAEWARSIGPIQPESYFCEIWQLEEIANGLDVFDARNIDYQGLETDVYRIMGPDWYDPLDQEVQ